MKKISLAKPKQVIEITEDGDYVAQFIGKQSKEKKLQLDFVHNKPGIKSRIHIKSVLYDQSKFDIEAKLVIAKGAHHTDTFLKIDCLIIDDGARARAVPSLEIEEDEVKAGHGATVGMLDEMQMHYLMSRGLSPETAQQEIVTAFLRKSL